MDDLSPTPKGHGSVVFKGVRVIMPHFITAECDLVVRNGRIALLTEEALVEPGTPVVDARGKYAAPGLIDIHCHSDGQHSFFVEGDRVAENLLRAGTTGVLATLAYCDMEPGKIHRQLEDYWTARGAVARQIVLGVHLEGPYTNPKYGALVREGQVHPPDPAEYGPILKHCSDYVKLWTIAPELPGIAALVRATAPHGIILGAGHSEATVDQLQPLLPYGLRVATHWSNATGIAPHRFRGTRNPGIDEYTLIEDTMSAEVICDAVGYHVGKPMLQLLYRAKGPDGIILISDAYWSEEGNPSTRADLDVHFTPDGKLNGSKLTMIAAARNFRKHIGCGLPELFRMGSLNPARLFGWAGEMGSVEPGKIANILLLDEALNLHGVWLAGRKVAMPE